MQSCGTGARPNNRSLVLIPPRAVVNPVARPTTQFLYLLRAALCSMLMRAKFLQRVEGARVRSCPVVLVHLEGARVVHLAEVLAVQCCGQGVLLLGPVAEALVRRWQPLGVNAPQVIVEHVQNRAKGGPLEESIPLLLLARPTCLGHSEHTRSKGSAWTVFH